MKTCTKCGVPQDLEAFSRNSSRKDGRQSDCKTCVAARMRVYYKDKCATDGDALRAAGRAYRQANKDRLLATKKAYIEANREAVKRRKRAWHEKNRERQAQMKRDRRAARTEEQIAEDRRKANALARKKPVERRIQCVKRRADQLQRTPAWADHEKIAEVYAMADRISKRAVDKVHVDHIYPLRGKTVSGLHVHNNLRVMLASFNQRKNAKFMEPDGEESMEAMQELIVSMCTPREEDFVILPRSFDATPA